MERQEGYYWVKSKYGYYFIAQWESGKWFVCGSSDIWFDEEFEHINESRIKAPGELPE